MPLPGWIRRRRISLTISLTTLSLLVLAKAAEPPRNWLPETPEPKQPVVARCPAITNPDPLMGPRTRMPGRWKGISTMFLFFTPISLKLLPEREFWSTRSQDLRSRRKPSDR